MFYTQEMSQALVKISRSPTKYKLYIRTRYVFLLLLMACYFIPFYSGNGWRNEYWLYMLSPLLLLPAFRKLQKVESGTADEVFDCEESLLFRAGGQEEYVRLSNISAIHAPGNTRAPKITILLKTPGRFGPVLYFFARAEPGFNPFAINSVAQSLLLRVSDSGGRILDAPPPAREETPRKLL